MPLIDFNDFVQEQKKEPKIETEKINQIEKPETNIIDFNDFKPEQTVSNINIPQETLAGRNNNPGNLRFVGQKNASQGEGGFAKFDSPESGYQALKDQINLDSSRGHTLGTFINKYAPESENDTDNYLKFIMQSTGANKDSLLNQIDQDKLAEAMAKFESGTTIKQPTTVGSNIEQRVEGNIPFEEQTPLDRLNAFPTNLLNELKSIGQEFKEAKNIAPFNEKELTPGTPEFEKRSLQELTAPFTEILPQAALGIVDFLIAKPALLTSTGMINVLENLDLIEKTDAKTKKEWRDKLEQNIATLGGLVETKTATGALGMKAIELALRPITTFVESRLQSAGAGKDFKKKYPNLYDSLQYGGEVFAFGAVPKIKERIKSVEAKTGKARTNAENALFNKIEKTIEKNKNNVKDLIKERQERNQKILNSAEGFSAFDIPQKKGIPGLEDFSNYIIKNAERARQRISEVPEGIKEIKEEGTKTTKEQKTAIERFQNQFIPGPEKISLKPETAAERKARLENEPIEISLNKIKLGEEPVTGTKAVAPTETAQSHKVEFLSEEGTPKREYRIDSNGKIKEVDKTTARKSYQINPDGKVELTEEIKAPRKVFQSIFNPLKDQSGEVNIDLLKETFGKTLKGAGFYNQLIKQGLSPKDLDLSGLGPYLKELGHNKIDYKKIKELVDNDRFNIDRVELSEKNKLSFAELTDTSGEFDFDSNLLSWPVYDEYRSPGGTPGTYKEKLFYYRPEGDLIYEAPHFTDGRNSNLLAHARGDERVLIVKNEPKKVAYVDEVQSDWHSDGQNIGYRDKDIKNKIIDQYAKEAGIIPKYNSDGSVTVRTEKVIKDYLTEKGELNKLRKLDKAITANLISVPNAPFKKTWPNMVMRDFIYEAVNSDKDGISWSTGKLQADRWGGPQSKRDAIYDKTLVKFMKKESGVKPEKILNENNEPVWYVPITDKLKKLYLNRNIPKTIFDQLMEPFKNDKGFIRIPGAKEKVLEKLTEAEKENILTLGDKAFENGKSLKSFLIDAGFNKKEIKQLIDIYEVVKSERPGKVLEYADVDFDSNGKIKDPFKVYPDERNVNIGPEANKNILISDRIVNQMQNAIRSVTPAIVRSFEPSWAAIRKFKAPFLNDLLHKAYSIENAMNADKKIFYNKLIDLNKKYPNKKERENAYIKIMSQDQIGRELIERSGRRPIDGEIKYESLIDDLKILTDDFFDQVNKIRKKIGKPQIAKRTSYLPIIARENFYLSLRKLFKGEKGEYKQPNIVLDSAKEINTRQDVSVNDSPAFRHLRRKGSFTGIKLETDPLLLLKKYGDSAYKHIHYSPLNMFVNQLAENSFIDPKTGKRKWSLKNVNPELHEYISRWSNKLAGRPNMIAPAALRPLEKAASAMSKNLTLATLGWSLRTVAVQPTAIVPTIAEYSMPATIKAIVRTAFDSKKDPIDSSQVLQHRVQDAIISDTKNMLIGGRLRRSVSSYQEKAMWMLQYLDKKTAEATWRVAYQDAIKDFPREVAIRKADEAVIRTQGSGFAGDLSPIQMNAFGKTITLWQTYTINHLNWLAKEVLNIKNPERNLDQTLRRAFKYIAGTMLVNNIFENQLGIQSPQPAPVNAMIKALEEGDKNWTVAYKGLLELSEFLPVMSSLKYGSNPGGAVIEFLSDLNKAASNDLPKALNGDKKAMKRVAIIAAKLWGVAGAQQIKRFEQGQPFGYKIKETNKSGGFNRIKRRSFRRGF